ncbi:MAG: VWA domain-containing protein [Myxococcales bacterium]|nr:VWA domain-containing protein [Myxococcales bacterium]
MNHGEGFRFGLAWAVLGLMGACASATPLPRTPALELLTEPEVFANAPPPEWPTVAPEDPTKASVEVSCGVAPLLPNGRLYTALSVRGRTMNGEVAPLNVGLVLDRSGSMRGRPFAAMLQAAEAFVAAFREGDKVSLVVFSDGVFEALPPLTIDASTRTEAITRIRALANGGGTWLSGGYLAGLSETFSAFSAWQVNQLVLFSDGQPTKGLAAPEALFRIAARAAEHGVGTTTIGFGPAHDELLMQGMADAGGGTYHFVGSPADIPAIFQREANAILRTAVRNTWVEIDVPSGLTVEDVIGWDYLVSGSKLYVFVGAVPHGEERYAVVKYLPEGGLRPGPVNTLVTYADVNRRGKFGVSCAPGIVAGGGRDTWVFTLAGRAEAAWGLAEAMGWADAGSDVYAISQLAHSRDVLAMMRAKLAPGALGAEDALLAEAQTRLGIGVAERATNSFLSGGVAGLVNFATKTAETTAASAVADKVDGNFAPLVRRGLPVTFYGRSGTRFSARGQRPFKLYAPEKSHTYKQARFDAYVMMRVRPR